jgi:hypothetical protein
LRCHNILQVTLTKCTWSRIWPLETQKPTKRRQNKRGNIHYE